MTTSQSVAPAKRTAAKVQYTGQIFELDGHVIRVSDDGMFMTIHVKDGVLYAQTIEDMSKRIASANEDAEAHRKLEREKAAQRRKRKARSVPAVLFSYGGDVDRVVVRGAHATKSGQALITYDSGNKDTAYFARLLTADTDVDHLKLLYQAATAADKAEDSYIRGHRIALPRNLYSNAKLYRDYDLLPEADLPPDLEITFAFDERTKEGVFSAEVPDYWMMASSSSRALVQAARWAWLTRGMEYVTVSPHGYDAHNDTRRIPRQQMVEEILEDKDKVNTVFDESFDHEHLAELTKVKIARNQELRSYLMAHAFPRDTVD